MSGRRWLTAVAGVYALGMALAAVITRGAVDRFDERTTAELRRWVASHPAVGEVAAKLTIIGSPIVLVAVVLAGAVWLEGRGDRRAAITLVLIGGLGAMVETALKVTIARARPELDPLVFARGSSFPSGHAMNSMIVLVATARLVAGARSTPTDGAAPRRRVGIATGAALAVAIPIGVSRVALGVHHPGDVVSGWVLAALWLTLTLGEARLPSEASPLAAGERLADRTHGEAGQHQRDAGNALAVVAHPLQFGGNLQNGRQRTQVARHRLLHGDQRQAVVLDGEAFLVDQAVVRDQLSGGIQVATLQNVHGIENGLLDHAAQEKDICLQFFDLTFKVLTN